MMWGMATSPPSLGTRIRRARERARLSQEELATAVGASVRAVGDWENDRRKPRNRIGALEDVLGVRLDDEPPADDLLTPRDEHERLIISSPDLPDDSKRVMVDSYRRMQVKLGVGGLSPRETGAPGRPAEAS
jgi:transcriptional regulator with XRE-family HTH domain